MFFEIATIVAFVAWVTSGTRSSAPASVPNQLKAKGQAYKDHIKQADRTMAQARTIRVSNSSNNRGNQQLKNLYTRAADHAHKANIELSSVYITRGTRDALFGSRERVLTALVAVKVFVAVGLIVAGMYGAQTAIAWLIENVTGPSAESSIEQMVSHLPVPGSQQETEEMELQFLEAERGLAGLESLRAEAARIVLGEEPAVREVLTVAFLSQSNRRWFREIVAAFVTAGVTLIAGLLLVSLLLEPFLYWKLEHDARLSKKN